VEERRQGPNGWDGRPELGRQVNRVQPRPGGVWDGADRGLGRRVRARLVVRVRDRDARSGGGIERE
jgi:hypothetical protein